MHHARNGRVGRRSLIIGIAATVLGARRTSGNTSLDAIAGCCLRAGDIAKFNIRMHGLGAALGGDDLITTTGDRDLDHYLGRALLRLADEFDVNPGFGFYDDTGNLNAFASPDTLPQLPGTKRTVCFGVNLFRRTLSLGDNGIAVIAVCAHEFGHVVQYNTGYRDRLLSGRPTVKLLELHADYFAGYHLARRKAEYPSLNVQGAGSLIDSIGDTAYTSPQHHGTSEERVAAIEAGYALGRKGKYRIGSVARAGADYVERVGD
jgi:hypothetical protein